MSVIRLHATLAASLANGPKRSFVVWVQGCTMDCPGCCNPGSHDPGGGYEKDVDELADGIIRDGSIGGLTISGGEPLEQLDAVLHLVTVVRRFRPDLCIVLFTGHEFPGEKVRIHAVAGSGTWKFHRLIGQLDVLVEGPYLQEAPGKDPLAASTNQKVSFPAGRFGPDDLVDIPRVELFVNEKGEIIESGLGNVLPRKEEKA